jgi:osmotically inducible lipoprotein OsmB
LPKAARLFDRARQALLRIWGRELAAPTVFRVRWSVGCGAGTYDERSVERRRDPTEAPQHGSPRSTEPDARMPVLDVPETEREDEMVRFALVAALLGLGLAGCGDTRLERGTTGAGIGAAAGAATSGVTGGSLLGGALLGGAAGGAAGALTDEDDIDLGEPFWDRDNDDDDND